MSIELRQEDFAAFFDAPFDCYPEGTPVASPMRGDLKRALDMKINPLFAEGHARRSWFTAHREGRVVGRILALIHDESNRRQGLSRGDFGCFDCIDDEAVAAALLGSAERWLAECGCTEIAGSFNFTITQMIGIVTEGHAEAPYTYQDWQPAHIARLLATQGYTPYFPMRTFEIDVARYDVARLRTPKIDALLTDPEWSFAPVRRRDLDATLRTCCVLLNDGFTHNALFTPLTEAEFLFPCEGMSWIMDERISWIARHRGEPAGVLLCIPDLNPFLAATRSRFRWNTLWHLLRFRLRRDRAAVVFASMRQQYQNHGVLGALLHHAIAALHDAGYHTLGVSWITDTNTGSLRQMEKLDARPLHRLHLFRKALSLTDAAA